MLVHSLELRRNRNRTKRFQRRMLVPIRKDRMILRHSLVHKLICKRACSSIRKA